MSPGLACEGGGGGEEERNLITSDGCTPNQIKHGTGWKWHPAVVLAWESTCSFNKSKWNEICLLFPDVPNIAKFSSNANHPPRWTDVITAAYYHHIYIFFLACECCYANGMCALWTAGFRWLISATHLQSAFVWGPTAWRRRWFFQKWSNWWESSATGMLFGNVPLLVMRRFILCRI